MSRQPTDHMEHIELEVIEPISRQGRTLPVGARFNGPANGSHVQRWLRTKKVRELRPEKGTGAGAEATDARRVQPRQPKREAENGNHADAKQGVGLFTRGVAAPIRADPRRFAAAVTLHVDMRERPGINFSAWCCGQRATCTSDDATAARRAVAKHVAAKVATIPDLWPARIREERIQLRRKPSGHFDAIIPAVVPGQCFACGCIDADCSGCIARTGKPCHWANADRTLCSACVE